MYLTLLLIVIVLCCIGFMLQNGLWGNAIMLVNTVIAALLAVNFFEPLANYLDGLDPSFTYLTDFLGLWFVFAISVALLRAITDQLSKVRVKFRKPFDEIGAVFFAAWTGWVMVCFTLMTLHTAPLGRTFMQEAFQPEPKSRMFFGLAPDRQWLAFSQKSSQGVFSRGETFDEFGDYILKYSERRHRFEAEPQTRVR
jgi:hypothetical protein